MTYTFKWLDKDHSCLFRNFCDLETGQYETKWVPASEFDPDYQAFLKWCEEGNEPLPYVAPTVIDGIEDLAQAKTVASASVRSQSYNLLQPTDWYVVRFTETQTEIPENITVFRETIRTESSSKIVTVESKETLEDLKNYLRSEEYSTWTELQ